MSIFKKSNHKKNLIVFQNYVKITLKLKNEIKKTLDS